MPARSAAILKNHFGPIVHQPEWDDLIDTIFDESSTGLPSSIFIPAIGGNNAAGAARTWMDGTIGATIIGINTETDGVAAGIWHCPYNSATLTAIPVVANNDPQQTAGVTFSMKTWQLNLSGAIEYETVTADVTLAANDLNWVSDLQLSISVVKNDLVTFLWVQGDSANEWAVWGLYCTLS
jgi:hypothetical protein